MFSHFYRNQTNTNLPDDGYQNMEAQSACVEWDNTSEMSMGHGNHETHYHSVDSCSGELEEG